MVGIRKNLLSIAIFASWILWPGNKGLVVVRVPRKIEVLKKLEGRGEHLTDTYTWSVSLFFPAQSKNFVILTLCEKKIETRNLFRNESFFDSNQSFS